MVSQYDVEIFQRLEHLIEIKIPLYETEENQVMLLQERVAEAQRVAKTQLKDMEDSKKHGNKRKRSQHDADGNNGFESWYDGKKRVNFNKKGKMQKFRKPNKY